MASPAFVEFDGSPRNTPPVGLDVRPIRALSEVSFRVEAGEVLGLARAQSGRKDDAGQDSRCHSPAPPQAV